MTLPRQSKLKLCVRLSQRLSRSRQHKSSETQTETSHYLVMTPLCSGLGHKMVWSCLSARWQILCRIYNLKSIRVNLVGGECRARHHGWTSGAPVGWISQTNCSLGETGRDWEPTRKIEIIIEIPLSALLGAVLFVRAVDTILDTFFLVILIQTFITTALHWLHTVLSIKISLLIDLSVRSRLEKFHSLELFWVCLLLLLASPAQPSPAQTKVAGNAGQW